MKGGQSLVRLIDRTKLCPLFNYLSAVLGYGTPIRLTSDV